MRPYVRASVRACVCGMGAVGAELEDRYKLNPVVIVMNTVITVSVVFTYPVQVSYPIPFSPGMPPYSILAKAPHDAMKK